MTGLTRCCTRTAVLVTLLTAAVGCTDRITQPTGTIAPSAANHMVADEGGGGGGYLPPATPTLLKYFLVSNCDPTANPLVCRPYCDPVIPDCIQYAIDGQYFEIRQTIYEADGVTGVEYNEQRWHGDTGPIPGTGQIMSHNLCGYPGRFINVEVYELHTFNILFRKASFQIRAGDNGIHRHFGNGIIWSVDIQYSWPC